ncbi:MAG: ATP-binding cassette domain-containing protein [Candidatus Lokiarchaeota archaeon]|nr:ATP-binding cassette domain-containing protein [Candidatus Lokiarchaeota archaeon]
MSRGINAQDNPEERSYVYSDGTLLKRMVNYLFAYKRLFLMVCGLVTVGIAITVYSPIVLKYAIDDEFLTGNIDGLVFTAGIYIFLQIAAWLTSYGNEYAMALMGQKAVYELRQELYEQLQCLSQDFYDQSSSGRVISRITNDIDRMSELLSGGLISSFAQIFVVFAIGFAIFFFDLYMAIATITVVPILLLTTIYFRKKMREAYRSTRKTISSVTANLAESISGAKVTKSFARERISIERFDEVNRADYESNIDAGRAQSAFFPTVRFIGGLGIFFILWIGGFLLIQGMTTIGTIVMFMQYSSSFFRPILIITNFYTSVQSAFAGAERVFLILDEEPSITDEDDAIEMPDVEGHIVFDNVTFSYVEGKVVLENFDLEIEKGETIALVGDTGAGKTTVVSLLNRFYDVQEGAIRIDGIDIREVKQKSLHSKIGLVLQDAFLFMGTVKDNIRYGRPDASDKEIIEATELIGARRIIEGLDEGFDTEVGERGSRLSEGERQLVSFSRALLADPSILVLDEATSSIDIYTEHAIQKGMKTLLRGRTSIVIAHRLSTIVNADRIVVLEEGKIVETGTHRKLMEKKGKYYSLYELQIRPRAQQSMISK